MINIFETREIQVKEWSYIKKTLQRISDWRNGIAVARWRFGYFSKSFNYCLIDKDYNFLYENVCDEDEEESLEGEQIERVFGGYYIVRSLKTMGCRTFPGRDTDTEYYYKTVVRDVIDENGIVLTENERKAYLESNSIKQTTEYGDGIIQCGLSFYSLDNYQHIFDISKEIEPLGFFKDGKCKVKVISDYRDFVVIVKDKLIEHVFNAEDFIYISKLFGIDLKTWGRQSLESSNKYYKPVARKPNDITSFKEIKPEIEIAICNYEFSLGSQYYISVGGDLYYDENYGFYRTRLIPITQYYCVENEWRKIDEADSKPIFDKIFKQKCNRPNFIKDIEIIATDILLDGEKYSIYKFECRPYGYITKVGKLDYNFDVNNIKW